MGIFDFFKKIVNSTEKKDTTDLSINFSGAEYHFDEEYFELLQKRPIFNDYTDRPLNYPKYSDTYQTGTPYNLRELLLLVWWGNTKNGRKSSVNIPKYFFYDYNLDAQMITRSFFENKLLIEENDKITLTENGRRLFDRFYPLWEIHSVKNYPMNLDENFPGWNKKEFDVKYYKQMIKYYADSAAHSSRVIEYIKSSDSFDNTRNELQYHISNRDSSQLNAKDFKEKLEVLESNHENNY